MWCKCERREILHNPTITSPSVSGSVSLAVTFTAASQFSAPSSGRRGGSRGWSFASPTSVRPGDRASLEGRDRRALDTFQTGYFPHPPAKAWGDFSPPSPREPAGLLEIKVMDAGP